MEEKKEIALNVNDIKNVNEMTYDEIMSIKKKDLKKISREKEVRHLKLLQLISKKEEINGKLLRLNTEFIDSLKSAELDSIKIKIDILTAKKELEIVNELLNTLFPDFNQNKIEK